MRSVQVEETKASIPSLDQMKAISISLVLWRRGLQDNLKFLFFPSYIAIWYMTALPGQQQHEPRRINCKRKQEWVYYSLTDYFIWQFFFKVLTTQEFMGSGSLQQVNYCRLMKSVGSNLYKKFWSKKTYKSVHSHNSIQLHSLSVANSCYFGSFLLRLWFWNQEITQGSA